MNSSISSSEARQGLRLFGGTLLAALVLFLAASEVLVRWQVEGQDEFIPHVELFTQAVSADAAFGDSHVARGFVPPEGMVNLAYPAENIDQIDWKVRTYFAIRKAGRVLLTADPHLLAPYRLNRRLERYPERFTQAPDTGFWHLRILETRYRVNLVRYWASLVSSGGSLVSRIQVLDNGAMLSPGDLSTDPLPWRRFEARQRVIEHKMGQEDAVKERLDQYARLVEFLRRRGADLCLATFPLSPDYRQAIDETWSAADKARRDAVLDFFRTLAERTGARYVDLQDLSADPADFRDVDHLNGQAAMKFAPTIETACFN